MGRKKTVTNLPMYDELFEPTVKALKLLGGSGTVEEINTKVFEIKDFSEEILQIPHGDSGSRSEIEYRLAWSRTYLKKFGLLDNSLRGIWALTKKGNDINEIDPNEIKKVVKEQQKTTGLNNKINQLVTTENEIDVEVSDTELWKQTLLNTLYQIHYSAFERLAQRILRESGFIQVEVTGKSGDGGIDGKGIVRINGFLSFHVIFQCKRYKGAITPDKIRDFRGAMQGRADKGLFITTGTFTKESIKEATRDGAPPIDLIDGDLLCDKLKELKLGVGTKEVIEIRQDWFTNL